jgi:cysteine desulfurase / selenocysteine lyase
VSGVYLNNAATSFPKPTSVIDAVFGALSNEVSEPGRGTGGNDPISLCRGTLATFFDVADPDRICLLPSATYALNTVICGLLWDGGHAVSSVLEHNSMLRPLNHMAEDRGASVTLVRVGREGQIDPDEVRGAVRKDTRLIAVTHASNVTGAIQPIDELAVVAAEADIPLLVDAAQSAGAVPLSHASLPGRIFVAFAGHKGLLGPTGTGGLILPDNTLRQTVYGGTGIRSETPLHPGSLPLRHEAGTPNISGIAGLRAGVSYILGNGVDAIGKARDKLVCAMRDALEPLPGLSLLPLPNRDGRAGVVSFITRNHPPEEVGFLLHEVFGISVRTGLHCAPLIHEQMGTAPLGTIRASVGPFNTMADVERLTTALEEVCCE